MYNGECQSFVLSLLYKLSCLSHVYAAVFKNCHSTILPKSAIKQKFQKNFLKLLHMFLYVLIDRLISCRNSLDLKIIIIS